MKELLEEAEDVLKNAPKQWRGDVVDAGAPVSKQEGWWADLRSLGTNFESTIPFGIYLDDDADLNQLNYFRLVEDQIVHGLVIIVKLNLVFVAFPIIVLFSIVKYL